MSAIGHCGHLGARLADVAAVQDQPVVRVLREFRRRDLDQAVLDFAHVAPGREPGAVRDPEDVRVHGDRRLAEGRVHARRSRSCGRRRAAPRAPRARAALRRRGARRIICVAAIDVLRLHAPQADRADVSRRARPRRARRIASGVPATRNSGAGGEVDAPVGRLGRQDDGDEELVRRCGRQARCAAPGLRRAGARTAGGRPAAPSRSARAVPSPACARDAR